jgi:hypothetical protein
VRRRQVLLDRIEDRMGEMKALASEDAGVEQVPDRFPISETQAGGHQLPIGVAEARRCKDLPRIKVQHGVGERAAQKRGSGFGGVVLGHARGG